MTCPYCGSGNIYPIAILEKENGDFVEWNACGECDEDFELPTLVISERLDG